jgi:C-terminal processing protease CtpA/Prc
MVCDPAGFSFVREGIEPDTVVPPPLAVMMLTAPTL